MRIALGVEYDGSRFFGWQIQPHARSVQEDLEAALSKVANHPVRVVCAGRTDTGVHAMGQVVHFDTDADRTERSWLLGCSVNLPDDLSVVWAKQMSDDFHARFKAVSRCYRYIILNRATRLSLLHRKVTWVRQPLDLMKMQVAAQDLLGEHDFSSFRAVRCQANHPVRVIHSIHLTSSAEYIYFDIVANAFLHHMVRNIAGVLMSIGHGDKPVTWVRDLLQLRDRRVGGVTAPADGLYLVAVGYPDEFAVPKPCNAIVFS
jgi:tRNA pseudouridine38-40 synthase